MASRWRGETSTEINLTPLLDVIFCLLFFFVLATSIRRETDAIEVQIPESGRTATSPENEDLLEIRIAAGGEIIFRDETVTAQDLTARLQALAAQGAAAERRVTIRADRDADVQTFVDVLDACAAAGMRVADVPVLSRVRR